MLQNITRNPIGRLKYLVLAATLSSCDNKSSLGEPSSSNHISVTMPIQDQRIAPIQKKMLEVNSELSAIFLTKYPEETETVNKINQSPIPFGTYVSEMVAIAINSSKQYKNGEEFGKAFFANPGVLVTGIYTSSDVISELSKIRSNPSLISLFTKVVELGNIYSRKSEPNKFDQLSITYMALRTGIRTLEVISAAQHAGESLQNLSYYTQPNSAVANSDYAYIDLASGCNFDSNLPNILTAKVKRPIILIDISPYVKKYWEDISSILDLKNIRVLNLDIHNISKDTIPGKVGTIRLQNVAAWVPGLDLNWAKKITELVDSSGQIVMVQSSSFLFSSQRQKPESMTAQEFVASVSNNKPNFDLAVNFIKAYDDMSALACGHVDRAGNFNEGMTGYFVPHGNRAAEVFENIIVFKKPSNK